MQCSVDGALVGDGHETRSGGLIKVAFDVDLALDEVDLAGFCGGFGELVHGLLAVAHGDGDVFDGEAFALSVHAHGHGGAGAQATQEQSVGVGGGVVSA